MNSIAPVWDGNETWLILGAMGLFAAFPLAFAIIIPAVYFPVVVMLLALIFRGVAFEFRFRDAPHRTFWDYGFAYGSLLATFAQGIVLGAFIQGFQTEGYTFTGSSLDCFTPFSIADRDLPRVRLCAAGRGLARAEDRGRPAGLGTPARAVGFPGRVRGGVAGQHLDAGDGAGHRPALVLLAEHPAAGAGADHHAADRLGDMAGAQSHELALGRRSPARSGCSRCPISASRSASGR